MEHQSQDTRQALILAAGELFAMFGYDAVSTRAIADKAGVNLGGIHYHFGGKERLYLEAFRYICDRGDKPRVQQIMDRDPQRLTTPAGLAAVIHEAVTANLTDFLLPQRPEWHIKLLMRELSNPSSALPMLMESLFQPEHEAWVSLYQRVRPSAPESEARAWAFIEGAMTVFYSHARAPILDVLGTETYSGEFINHVAEQTASAMILLLGLPLPRALQHADQTTQETTP